MKGWRRPLEEAAREAVREKRREVEAELEGEVFDPRRVPFSRGAASAPQRGARTKQVWMTDRDLDLLDAMSSAAGVSRETILSQSLEEFALRLKVSVQ